MNSKSLSKRVSKNALKCLIYFVRIKKGGGPSGYLNHLRTGLKQIKNADIAVLSSRFHPAPQITNIARSGLFKEKINAIIRKPNAKFLIDIALYIFKTVHTPLTEPFFSKVFGLKNTYIHQTLLLDAIIEAKSPKMLHFHDLHQAYAFQGFSRYKNAIPWMITYHSPSGYAQEQNDILIRYGQGKYYLYFRYLRHVLKTVYQKANFIMVPSIHSLEGQVKYLSELKKSITFPGKVKTVLTGIDNRYVIPTKTRAETLSFYGIDDRKFVVSFLGRGLVDKGYDLFLELAKIMSQDNRLVFVKSGTDYNLEKKPTNIKEVGWVSNIFDLMAASDIIINPNRCSFFDLVVLEAMSLGKIILTTSVGGHKEFAHLTHGIILAEPTVISLKENLELLISKTPEERKLLEMENLSTFREKFTVEKFARNYEVLIEEVLKNRKVIVN